MPSFFFAVGAVRSNRHWPPDFAFVNFHALHAPASFVHSVQQLPLSFTLSISL